MMTKTFRQLLAVLWLVVITPIFGLVPLLVKSHTISTGNPIWLLDMAILRDVWNKFFTDPYPGLSDVPPPLTETQWWMLIVVVLLVAAVAIYDLGYRSHNTVTSE